MRAGVRGCGRECVLAPLLGGRCRWGAAGPCRSLSHADKLLEISANIAWLDGMHAVFGCATEGMGIGKKIEAAMVFVCTTTFSVMTKP